MLVGSQASKRSFPCMEDHMVEDVSFSDVSSSPLKYPRVLSSFKQTNPFTSQARQVRLSFGLSDCNVGHCIAVMFSDVCLMWHLTNRFHVAIRLFSNRSQKTLKCRKNTNWHKPLGECVTDVLTTF